MRAVISRVGYESPTPVQAGVIPLALAGRDVLAQAQTGTGKTAAFAIPILERLTKSTQLPQSLVMVPTRELAEQVRTEFAKLAAKWQVCLVMSGGKGMREQIDQLKRGTQVVVGTPGRVIDHLRRGTLNPRDLSCVVLDEADRMLDIGFRPDIEKILRQCPDDRQTMLLSATVPPAVVRIAKRYMRRPAAINFSTLQVAVHTIEQHYFTVDRERKYELLMKLLEREQPQQAIVFCRTRRGTERISTRARSAFDRVGCIHGDMPQPARDRTMRDFRDRKLRILFATDVVGRGIDVSSISHIINFDVPEDCDDYVHRVGRTGRMGRAGIAYTFVSPSEGDQLTRIEMRINCLLQRDEMPGITNPPGQDANSNLAQPAHFPSAYSHGAPRAAGPLPAFGHPSLIRDPVATSDSASEADPPCEAGRAPQAAGVSDANTASAASTAPEATTAPEASAAPEDNERSATRGRRYRRAL